MFLSLCLILLNLQSLEHDDEVTSVDIDLDGVYLVAAMGTGKVQLWTLHSSSGTVKTQQKISINAHNRYILKCKFSPDSRLVFPEYQLNMNKYLSTPFWDITYLP